MRIPWYLILLLVLATTACSALNPSEAQRKSALDDFMYALRWQRYQDAASFFTSEHREAFLEQIEPVEKSLNVTDVRLQRLDLKEEGRRAETRMEMDYYILPSASLRTLRIDLTWINFEKGGAERSGFLITTPFPKFPEESSRSKSLGKGTLPP
jgi:hypothetical protein